MDFWTCRKMRPTWSCSGAESQRMHSPSAVKLLTVFLAAASYKTKLARGETTSLAAAPRMTWLKFWRLASAHTQYQVLPLHLNVNFDSLDAHFVCTLPTGQIHRTARSPCPLRDLLRWTTCANSLTRKRLQDSQARRSNTWSTEKCQHRLTAGAQAASYSHGRRCGGTPSPSITSESASSMLISG